MEMIIFSAASLLNFTHFYMKLDSLLGLLPDHAVLANVKLHHGVLAVGFKDFVSDRTDSVAGSTRSPCLSPSMQIIPLSCCTSRCFHRNVRHEACSFVLAVGVGTECGTDFWKGLNCGAAAGACRVTSDSST